MASSFSLVNCKCIRFGSGGFMIIDYPPPPHQASMAMGVELAKTIIYKLFIVYCHLFWVNQFCFINFRVLKYTNIDTRYTIHEDFMYHVLNSDPDFIVFILKSTAFDAIFNFFYCCTSSYFFRSPVFVVQSTRTVLVVQY